MSSPARLAQRLALAAACLAGPGCARSAPPAAPPRPPNVVLVTLDTVRADHLSAYGYPVATSPRLEAFARQATLYRRAWATSPWTIPTHASLFTGKFPFEHGAITFKVDDPAARNAWPLPPEHVTLAEALRAAGYQTAAFVANGGYLAPHWGFNQGFDSYLTRQVYAARLNEPVRRFLRRQARAPFFLFVNYIDAHRPYNSVERPGLLPRPVTPPDDGRLLVRLAEEVLPARKPVPAELRQKVVDQYDTALANLDEELGRLFDRLAELRHYDDTLIVVTSDHGEYFGEHHLVEHSKDVYEAALRVPLVVKLPGQRQGRVDDTPLSLVDVPRLVLEALPGAVARDQLERFPYRPGSHPVLAENEFTRAKDLVGRPWSWRFQRVRTAFYEGPFKLLRSSDGRHELYELERDPRESADLAATDRERLGRLMASLERFEASRARYRHTGLPGMAEPDAEEREQLRSLGYLD